MQYLKEGSTLQGGKYTIQRIKQQDNLTITYQARQNRLDRTVCIAEFFMKDFCARKENSAEVVYGKYSEQINSFKNKFVADAKSMKAPNDNKDIETVDLFEENNTVYCVYLDLCTNGDKQEVHVDMGATANKPRGSRTERVSVAINAGIPKDPIKPQPDFSHKHRDGIIKGVVVVTCLTLGIAAASLTISYNTDDNMADTSNNISDAVASYSPVHDNDMQSASLPTGDVTQKELDDYLRQSEEWYELSLKNRHKPSNVQNILNAKYFYYDKANSVNVKLKGTRLPTNEKIEKLAQEEYSYWINEAKKLGSNKKRFALKRTYLQRARALACRHQNMLDAQIKWLDTQLAKNNKNRHRRK